MNTAPWRGLAHLALVPMLAACAATVVLWFALLPQTVQAQCGTQMSSCRNCHEVKAQLKVNTKGDWHVDHAFGDFCVTCHAGDAKAKDKAAAHVGMMKPLENVTAACASCHPADLKARADRYAATLGITAQMGSGVSSPPVQAPGAAPTPATSQPTPSGGAGLADCGPIDGVVVGGLLDFNALPPAEPGVNWGNVVLSVLIVLIGLAWAGIGLYDWVHGAGRGVAQQAALRLAGPVSPAVSALVPVLSQCDDETLRALSVLLRRGNAGMQAILAVSQLSPEWLNVARQADPADLVLAMVTARRLQQQSGSAHGSDQ